MADAAAATTTAATAATTAEITETDAAATTTAPADWRATLPEAMRNDATLGRYKDVTAAAQGLIEQHKALSSGLTKIPGKDAKPEEIAAFREKLGVPKDPAGYEFAAHPTLDGGALDTFKGIFHKLGIPKDAAAELVNAYAEWGQTVMDQQGQQYVEGLKTLAKQWGQPVYDKKVAYAQRGIDKAIALGNIEGLHEFLDASKMGDHPLLFQAWAAIGEQFAEDGLIEGRVSNLPTAEEAQRRINEMRADKKHPLNDINHPRHHEALDEVLTLTRLMLGKEGTKPVVTIG